jgi:hypothetical protein
VFEPSQNQDVATKNLEFPILVGMKHALSWREHHFFVTKWWLAGARKSMAGTRRQKNPLVNALLSGIDFPQYIYI